MNIALFHATLAKYKSLRHIKNLEQLRAYTGCGSSTTFRKWMQDPERIPIGELENMLKALKVPREEQVDIIFK